MKLINIIKWISRIWGGLSLTFILVFMAMYFAGDAENAQRPLNQEDIIGIIMGLFALFGLALAFKWPGVGGLLCTVALFYFKLSTRLELNLIDVLLFPGILHLISWFLQKWNSLRSSQEN